MSATINAFPPMHAFTSARSWFLAIIVLLHVGFFWALNSGLSPASLVKIVPRTFETFFEIDENKPVEPPPTPTDFQVPHDPSVVRVPVPVIEYDQSEDARIVGEALPPGPVPPVSTGGTSKPEPTLTQPQIDPRYGLSEPVYPASIIRQGISGTVLLSVYVLENGKVGDVRVEQSSGTQALDDSARREARKWRFKPGMRDGTPVAMWKQVPIKFQLRD